MTVSENKRFLRWGIYASGFLVVSLSLYHNYFKGGEYELISEVSVGFFLILSFILLGYLGLFPLWLRFFYKNLASPQQQKTLSGLGYLLIENYRDGE